MRSLPGGVGGGRRPILRQAQDDLLGGADAVGGRPILRQAQDDLLGRAVGGGAVVVWCIIAYLELARGAGG